jgi:hypothetical protein
MEGMAMDAIEKNGIFYSLANPVEFRTQFKSAGKVLSDHGIQDGEFESAMRRAFKKAGVENKCAFWGYNGHIILSVVLNGGDGSKEFAFKNVGSVLDRIEDEIQGEVVASSGNKTEIRFTGRVEQSTFMPGLKV